MYVFLAVKQIFKATAIPITKNFGPIAKIAGFYVRDSDRSLYGILPRSLFAAFVYSYSPVGKIPI
jgi:hypothetical protein